MQTVIKSLIGIPPDKCGSLSLTRQIADRQAVRIVIIGTSLLILNLVDGSMGICPVETHSQLPHPHPLRKNSQIARQPGPHIACSHIRPHSQAGVNMTAGEKW